MIGLDGTFHLIMYAQDDIETENREKSKIILKTLKSPEKSSELKIILV